MKKTIYVILWAFLGLIFSFIFHAIIEMVYLNWASAHNLDVHWVLSGACALPLWLFILLPALGIGFGIWAGFFFWGKVYIKKLRK